MKNICLYFHIHQPVRLKTYRFFEIGHNHLYFDDENNRRLIRRIADQSYLPQNNALLALIRKHNGKFRVSFSISGYLLHMFEKHMPDVISSFRELAGTGSVEFLSGTWSYSLASLGNKEEFSQQVMLYDQKIKALFGIKPSVFMNTELIYSDSIGEMIAKSGYRKALIEGADHALEWRSANYIYQHPVQKNLQLFMNNYRLSEYIAQDINHGIPGGRPVSADHLMNRLYQLPPEEKVVNILLDYETFGSKFRESYRNNDFLNSLVSQVLCEHGMGFATPSSLTGNPQPVSGIEVPCPVCWKGKGRDFSPWSWNELQSDIFKKLYALKEIIKKCRNAEIRQNWLWLQSSDHFFYMSSKWFENSNLMGYQNQYESPYLAYINYLNILSDFSERVNTYYLSKFQPKRTVVKKLAREKLSLEKADSTLEIRYKPAERLQTLKQEIKPNLTITNN